MASAVAGTGEPGVAGVAIRPAVPADAEAITAVHDAAFGGTAEGRIVEAIAASPDHLPELSLVAADADAVVGHVLLSRAWLVRGGGEPDLAILVLGPMGVTPARQRDGIGSALVRAALEAARRRGERVVVVLGHPTYYPRFGFAPARARGIEPPEPWPDAAWMALDLDDGGLGARGTARLAPAFDLADGSSER